MSRLCLLSPLLALLLLAGCKRAGKPATAPTPPAPVALGETFEKLTALDLVAQFDRDRKAAAAKYGGKTLDVTGVVCHVSFSAERGVGVHLVAGAKPEGVATDADGLLWRAHQPPERLECEIDKARSAAALGLLPAQTVTVRAAYADGTRPRLKLAQILSVEGSPSAKTYSLAEIRKSMGKRGIIPSELNRPAFVEGTVKSIEPTPDKDFYVIVAEDAAPGALPPVKLRLDVDVKTNSVPEFREYLEKLKPGDPFRAYGKLDHHLAEKSALAIRTAKRNQALLPPK